MKLDPNTKLSSIDSHLWTGVVFTFRYKHRPGLNHKNVLQKGTVGRGIHVSYDEESKRRMDVRCFTRRVGCDYVSVCCMRHGRTLKFRYQAEKSSVKIIGTLEGDYVSLKNEIISHCIEDSEHLLYNKIYRQERS